MYNFRNISMSKSPNLSSDQPETSIAGMTLSTYNRQHPFRHDEKGKSYDPIERDIDKYRALFRDPKNIDTALIKDLPLSAGILRSFAVVELGVEDGRGYGYFYELEQKYHNGDITDIFDYKKAILEMKKMIEAHNTRNRIFPNDGNGPGNPPAATQMMRESR